MKPYYDHDGVTVHHGNCLEVLAGLPDESIEAVCTDPPYGLGNTTPEQVADTIIRWVNGDRDYLPGGTGFMGKAWDAFVPPVAVWDECLRVLKPGGHLLAFSGSRTFDLMALGIRLAGFEVRDGIAWLYGSGFPKSLDVSKAIDKAAGAERKITGRGTKGMRVQSTWGEDGGSGVFRAGADGYDERDEPATHEALEWQGWGTALKPAFEPIVVARKPLAGTVAATVLEHGTGALNIDGCRIGTREHDPQFRPASASGVGNGKPCYGTRDGQEATYTEGRWPANVVFDEHQAAVLDQQSGVLTSGKMLAGTRPKGNRETYGRDAAAGYETTRDTPGDSGGASRFFYVAKADTSERVKLDGVAHPTVKPLDLMRWLVRLVTPPGGTVLEPFAGSGTTVEACLLEGFNVVAIEREADYLPLIRQRINRRRDPVAAVKATGDDAGLFDLLDDGKAS